MLRVIYRFLLKIHPYKFRRDFSDEMLEIFDEVSRREGLLALFSDCLVSLFRQWFLRSGLWKLIPAVACALLQVTAFGMLFSLPHHGDEANMAQLVKYGAAIAVMLIGTTLLGVWNFRKLAIRRRSHVSRRG